MNLDPSADAIRSENVWVFLDALSQVASRLSYVRALDAGSGRIVFVALQERAEGAGHRRLLRAWQARARAIGLSIPALAGRSAVGTNARAHEPSRGGEAGYLRISVGIEPAPIARAAAEALAEAVAEIAGGDALEGGPLEAFDEEESREQ